MSWEQLALREKLLDSRLPELVDTAKREFQSLETSLESLRSTSRTPAETKFLYSQAHVQEQKCKTALETLQSCQPRSQDEEHRKRRALCSLSASLEEWQSGLQPDIMLEQELKSQAAGEAWEREFRAELVTEQRQLEASLQDIKSMLSASAVMVKVQGEELDRLDVNLSTASGNVSKGLEQMEKADDQQVEARRKAAFALFLAVLVVAILCLVLFLQPSQSA